MTQLKRTLETMLQCEQDTELVNNQVHQSDTQNEVSDDDTDSFTPIVCLDDAVGIVNWQIKR